MHRLFETFAQFPRGDGLALHRVVVAPGALVEEAQLASGAVVNVTGRKRRDIVAMTGQRFHFRSDPQPAVAVVAPVQRADAERIAGNEITAELRIPKREGINAVELRYAVGAVELVPV